VTTWSTTTVQYRGLDGRRRLLCGWLPALVDEIGTGGTRFYADTIPPAATTPAADATGEIEAAIATDGRDAGEVAAAVTASLAGLLDEGIVTATAALTRPRLLDPVLFAGNAPLAIYTALLTEGTTRAIAILDEHDRPPRSIVAGEVEAFLELVGVEERVLLAEHYAKWLEGVARRRREADERAGAEPVSSPPIDPTATAVPAMATVAERQPLSEPIRQAFENEAASLPTSQRYELVGRLAHIQGMRLDPTLSLDDEAALVRGLLPRLAHRATPRRSS
jgi:hypothetical protein